MKNRLLKLNKINLTKVNVEKLKIDLEKLIKIDRIKIISDLQSARRQGDLSENAEYDAAKQKQGVLEKKILEITTILNNYKIIQKKAENVVRVGSEVVIEHQQTKKKMIFVIGTFSDFEIEKNIISNDSPLGKAMIGKPVNDKVFIKGLRFSYWIKILKIINSK